MHIAYLLEEILAHILYFTGAYWLWRRLLDRRSAGVVLVYHRVLGGKRKTGEMVGEDSFDWQLRYLKKNYDPVGWEEVVLQPGTGTRTKVLVTFDDGYRDNFTLALRLLEKHRIPAVFFPVTDFVFGKKRIDDEDCDDDIFPSKDELNRACESPCIIFGNHTASHRIVSELDIEEFEKELHESQREFRGELNVQPEVFAFPRGRKEDISSAVIPVLKESGMKAAFTMVPGLVDPKVDRYLIPRIGVSHVNNRILFKVKVSGLMNYLVKIRNYLSNRLNRR